MDKDQQKYVNIYRKTSVYKNTSRTKQEIGLVYERTIPSVTVCDTAIWNYPQFALAQNFVLFWQNTLAKQNIRKWILYLTCTTSLPIDVLRMITKTTHLSLTWNIGTGAWQRCLTHQQLGAERYQVLEKRNCEQTRSLTSKSKAQIYSMTQCARESSAMTNHPRMTSSSFKSNNNNNKIISICTNRLYCTFYK